MAVLIAGGSRGIGAACVRAFASKGERVAFFYHDNQEAAASIAKETGALAIQADVADKRAVFDGFQIARTQLGAIDTLVCAAGIAWTGLFQDMDEDALRRLMDVNALGSYFCAQAAAADMVANKLGSIIFISSIWGMVGASCEAAYSMSKGAQIALCKALAQELGPSGIRVNCVAPGVIDTDMNANLSGADMDALRDQTPIGRIGTAAEVAEAVLYLAGAAFVTGQVLSPNGGIVL